MRESTGYREAVARGRPEEFYDELYEGPVRDPELGVVIVGTYGLARQILDSRDGDFSNAATLAPLYMPVPDVGQTFGEIFGGSDTSTVVLLDGAIHRERRRHAISALSSVPDDDEALIDKALDQLGLRLDETAGRVHLANVLVEPLFRRSSLRRRTGIPDDLVDELGSLLPGQADLMWGLPSPERQMQLANEMRRIWDICSESIRRNHVDMASGTYAHNIITGYLSAKTDLAPEDQMDIYLQANAGYVSNVHTMGNVIVRSLQEPDRWRQLCDDIEQVPQHVQEMLGRYSGTHGWFRMVSPQSEVEIAGEKIQPGSRLIVAINAANQAADRQEGDPSLTFGHGPHSCLGRDYSIQLITSVVRGLVERFPTLRLVDEPRPWANLAFNGYPDAQVALSA